MKPDVSVVIPAHNPREDYLRRVLRSLERQTLPRERWELFLVDNASDRPLAPQYDISWHPRGMQVSEPKLGLTPARLAGIARASADLVVFVDDDNELFEDYLEVSLRIAEAFPFVGVWGGQIFGDFEDRDSRLAREHPDFFSIRSFSSIQWTNRKRDYSIMPIGAGLCVRTELLKEYARICAADPRRTMLDRTGTRLLTCGDLDIVFTACDLGFGKGLFPELKLNHLIPKRRLTMDFVRGNAEGNQYSATIQNFLVEGELPDFRQSSIQRVLRWVRLRRMNPLHRQIALAEGQGRRAAVADINRWGWVKEGMPVKLVKSD